MSGRPETRKQAIETVFDSLGERELPELEAYNTEQYQRLLSALVDAWVEWEAGRAPSDEEVRAAVEHIQVGRVAGLDADTIVRDTLVVARDVRVQ